MTLEGKEGDI